MDMSNVNLNEYKEKVKDYKYYKLVKKLIKILSGNNKTILDIGSANIDLMSEYSFSERVSVSLDGAINNDKIVGYQMDFFDFNVKKKFDIVTCLQVVEHIEDAKAFVQKILNSGKVCILSVPYKWEKDSCKYHVQDPIDENKIYGWTNTKSVFSFLVKDGSYRIIIVIGKLKLSEYLKIYPIYILNKLNDFLCNKLFSIRNQKSKNNKWYKVFYILGIKLSFRNKSKEKIESNKRKKEENLKKEHIINNKINEILNRIDNLDKCYNKNLEKNPISNFEIERCLEFKKQLEQIDLKIAYKELIKNLDINSVETVCTILSRILMIEEDKKYLIEDIFSNEEIEILKGIKSTFKNKIIKLDEDCYCYYYYYLPTKYFDTSVFYYKYELPLLEKINNIKNKSIIDAGAFVGDSALILESYCDKVYAFEPTSTNYDLLLKTIKLNNKSSKIIPIKKGLGSKKETANIHIDRGSSSINRVLRDNLEVETIEITTLDDFVNENNLDIGLIKVDIEGSEQDFLKGAENTIKTQKPILLISIYHSAFDFFQIKPYIESLNLDYNLKIVKNVDGSIRGEILLIAE